MVIWLHFLKMAGRDEEGGNDFREKEKIRRGCRGKLRDSRMLVYRGYFREFWRMVRGKVQCDQVGEILQ